MGRKSSLNEEEKGKIKAFKEMFLSNRQIAKRIGRSANVVDNFVKDMHNYGSKKSSGRPKMLTDRDKRQLIREAANSTKGSRRLAKEIVANVSHLTVWRSLNASENLKYVKMNQIPKLKPIHCQKRAEFADIFQTWNHEWKKVILEIINFKNTAEFFVGDMVG